MKSGVCARVWAAPCAILAISGLLAGCGGGGGGAVNPVATPSPSATPGINGVTARLAISPIGYLHPITEVQWSAPTFTPTTNVVEYHVYRNNVIAGVVSRGPFICYDAVGDSFPSVITYFTINASDTTKLNLVTVPTLPALVAGVPVTYRVTALYATPDTASSATPVYAETEIGQSDAVTPQ